MYQVLFIVTSKYFIHASFVTLIQVKNYHYHHLIEAKTKLLSDILKVLHLDQAYSPGYQISGNNVLSI